MAEPEEETVQLKLFGKDFACTVCNETEFWQENGWFYRKGGGLLNRTGETANCFVCSKCGYVHWFMPKRGAYLKDQQGQSDEGSVEASSDDSA